MTTKKKIFVAIASLAASVAIVMVSVFATVAYLTSSAAVSNVFTIGNVSMTMDETKVDANGVAVPNGGRTDTNTYKLVPNTKYKKDPTIHIMTGSENSYLFVLVRNDLEAIEIKAANAAKDGSELTIVQQLEKNGWKVFPGANASTGKVYVYHGFTDENKTTVNEKAVGVGVGDYKLFDYFMIDPNANVAAYGAAKITLTGVAIQTSGFGAVGETASLNAAWAAVIETYPYIHTGTSADSGNSGSTGTGGETA